MGFEQKLPSMLSHSFEDWVGFSKVISEGRVTTIWEFWTISWVFWNVMV